MAPVPVAQARVAADADAHAFMGIVVDAEGNVSFGVGHGLRTRAWMGQVALGAIEATAEEKELHWRACLNQALAPLHQPPPMLAEPVLATPWPAAAYPQQMAAAYQPRMLPAQGLGLEQEATAANERAPTCSHYPRGICHFGRACRHRHVRYVCEQTLASPHAQPCPSFPNCQSGSRCWFRHCAAPTAPLG